MDTSDGVTQDSTCTALFNSVTLKNSKQLLSLQQNPKDPTRLHSMDVSLKQNQIKRKKASGNRVEQVCGDMKNGSNRLLILDSPAL